MKYYDLLNNSRSDMVMKTISHRMPSVPYLLALFPGLAWPGARETRDRQIKSALQSLSWTCTAFVTPRKSTEALDSPVNVSHCCNGSLCRPLRLITYLSHTWLRQISVVSIDLHWYGRDHLHVIADLLRFMPLHALSWVTKWMMVPLLIEFTTDYDLASG